MSLRLIVTLVCVASPLPGQSLEPRQLEQAFDFGSFRQPVFLTHAGDGSGRVFVVERAGSIQVLDPESSTAHTFLDHTDDVNSGPGEGGLLSVAFHPRYADNGRLFVYYTFGNLTSRVAEFHVSGDPDAVDPASERVVFEIGQPAGNHNGGQLAFGPDGMLYIGLGDGGGGGDRFGNGQNPMTLLGTIMRIDVDVADGDLAYSVPSDNPFFGNDQGWREEIWAWGLRNPWRFGFDQLTGDLWTGDVGQSQWEEVDLIVKGGNYGWNVMEGFHCFQSSSCDDTDLEAPVIEYPRSDGVSITGGYVYRGTQLSQLYGAYVYGDFGSRRIWALRWDGTTPVEHAEIARPPSQISSFGQDEAGELYVVGYDGRIWRFLSLEGEEPRPTAVAEIVDGTPVGFALEQNYPNPFNPATTIEYALPAPESVRLAVYDVLGRRIRALADGPQPAGMHRVTWDGRDAAGQTVAAGVYIYQLATPVGTRTRRMVLVK